MKRYASPLTKTVTPDKWREKINLKMLSLDDMTDLLGDFKEMESMAKKLTGFLREAIIPRMPGGSTEYASSNFEFVLNTRTRAGNLNRDLVMDEMGEAWTIDHSNPSTEYTELRMNRIVEEPRV